MSMSRSIRNSLLVLSLAGLAACGGDSAQPTATTPAADATAPASNEAAHAAAFADQEQVEDVDAGYDESALQDPTMQMAARAGAGMVALVEVCDGVREADDLVLGAEQRRQLEEMGVDPAAYRVAYRTALVEARAKAAGMPAAERASACEEMARLKAMGEEMLRKQGG